MSIFLKYLSIFGNKALLKLLKIFLLKENASPGPMIKISHFDGETIFIFFLVKDFIK